MNGEARSPDPPERGEATKVDGRVRALVELSAALAAAGRKEVESALASAAERAPPREVEETLLQAHLFLGFPAALAGLRAWRELGAGEDTEDGTAAEGEEERPRAGPRPPEGWTARGERVCARVYGNAYPGLRENVSRLHPAVDAWMVSHGYGRVLGREGLDLATRELCIVATLAAGGWTAPLRSHLRGALRTGASPAAVEAAVEAGLSRADAVAADRSRMAWRELKAEGG